MIPNVDDKILLTEFDLKNCYPKPEAPWIKRCDFGIKFTDEIQVVDHNVLSDTEMSSMKDKDNKEEEVSDDEERE